jgi:hypothetical protein
VDTSNAPSPLISTRPVPSFAPPRRENITPWANFFNFPIALPASGDHSPLFAATFADTAHATTIKIKTFTAITFPTRDFIFEEYSSLISSSSSKIEPRSFVVLARGEGAAGLLGNSNAVSSSSLPWRLFSMSSSRGGCPEHRSIVYHVALSLSLFLFARAKAPLFFEWKMEFFAI